MDTDGLTAYNQIWARARTHENHYRFLQGSGLAIEIVKSVWRQSKVSESEEVRLNKDEFFKACKLIALAQNGIKATVENLAKHVPPPTFAILDEDTTANNAAGEDGEKGAREKAPPGLFTDTTVNGRGAKRRGAALGAKSSAAGGNRAGKKQRPPPATKRLVQRVAAAAAATGNRVAAAGTWAARSAWHTLEAGLPSSRTITATSLAGRPLDEWLKAMAVHPGPDRIGGLVTVDGVAMPYTAHYVPDESHKNMLICIDVAMVLESRELVRLRLKFWRTGKQGPYIDGLGASLETFFNTEADEKLLADTENSTDPYFADRRGALFVWTVLKLAAAVPNNTGSAAAISVLKKFGNTTEISANAARSAPITPRFVDNRDQVPLSRAHQEATEALIKVHDGETTGLSQPAGRYYWLKLDPFTGTGANMAAVALGSAP